MRSKISFFLAVSTVALIVFASPALSQSISSEIYETEEDLLEGFEKGYLTLDQYLELLDLLQSKLRLSSSDSDKLYLIPDVSSIDLLQAKAQNQNVVLGQKIGSFLAEADGGSGKLLSGRLVWKLREDFREGGETENYLLCEAARGERLTWRIEADHLSCTSQAISGSGTFRVRKRFLRILFPEYSGELVLGNFDRRIGLGLNVPSPFGLRRRVRSQVPPHFPLPGFRKVQWFLHGRAIRILPGSDPLFEKQRRGNRGSNQSSGPKL
jgi:hypothetical protein